MTDDRIIAGTSPRPAQTTTSPRRLMLLDLMRTVALYRVVLLHITGVEALSLLAAMPVMFFVAGSLMARSLGRDRALVVVGHRFRRILIPLAAYASYLVILWWSKGLLTTSISSVHGPGGWITEVGLYDIARLYVPVLSLGAPVGPGSPDDAVFWTWNALWYIHTHLLLVILAPLLFIAFRRRWKILYLAIGGLWALVMMSALASGSRDIDTFPTFLLFFTIGFAFNDGRLLGISRRTLMWMFIVFGVIGLGFAPMAPGLHINNWAPSLTFLGLSLIAGCIYWREPIENFARMHLVLPLIRFTNRRALSVYIWSLAGVYVSRLLLPTKGIPMVALAGSAIGSIAITAVVTIAACLAFGWLEDVAARRPAELWPTWK